MSEVCGNTTAGAEQWSLSMCLTNSVPCSCASHYLLVHALPKKGAAALLQCCASWPLFPSLDVRPDSPWEGGRTYILGITGTCTCVPCSADCARLCMCTGLCLCTGSCVC